MAAPNNQITGEEKFNIRKVLGLILIGYTKLYNKQNKNMCRYNDTQSVHL